MSKQIESKTETVVLRVSKHSRDMAKTIQKIVAVETNGEVLDKVRSLEIALEEFIDKRIDK